MHRLISRDVVVVQEVLPEVLDPLTKDLDFLNKGFKAASDYLEKKTRQANCSEETLKEANRQVFKLKYNHDYH